MFAGRVHLLMAYHTWDNTLHLAWVTPEAYVCICKGITDTQIRVAVEDGASSVHDVRNALGVASQCGDLASEIVHQSLHPQANSESLFYAVS